jgi:hypothetical protein
MPARISRIGLRPRRVLGLRRVDRGTEAERRRDDHRDPGDGERSGEEGGQVVAAPARQPAVADEHRQVDLADEQPRLLGESDDDERADHDRRARRGEERAVDDRLAPPPGRAAAQIHDA